MTLPPKYPRPKQPYLDEFIDALLEWLATGDLSQPFFHSMEHPESASGWVVRVDVELPLMTGRWGRDLDVPIDPASMSTRDEDPTARHEMETMFDHEEREAAERLGLVLDDALLMCLDDEEREVVELVVFGNMTLRDAGAELGCNQVRVMRRYRSAMEKLRDRLADDPVIQGLLKSEDRD